MTLGEKITAFLQERQISMEGEYKLTPQLIKDFIKKHYYRPINKQIPFPANEEELIHYQFVLMTELYYDNPDFYAMVDNPIKRLFTEYQLKALKILNENKSQQQKPDTHDSKRS